MTFGFHLHFASPAWPACRLSPLIYLSRSCRPQGLPTYRRPRGATGSGIMENAAQYGYDISDGFGRAALVSPLDVRWVCLTTPTGTYFGDSTPGRKDLGCSSVLTVANRRDPAGSWGIWLLTEATGGPVRRSGRCRGARTALHDGRDIPAASSEPPTRGGARLTADELWVCVGLSATVGLVLGIFAGWLASTLAMGRPDRGGIGMGVFRWRRRRLRRHSGASRYLAVPAPSVVESRCAIPALSALTGAARSAGHAVGANWTARRSAP